MKIAALLQSVPKQSLLVLAGLFMFLVVAWAYLLGNSFSVNLSVWLFAFAAGLLFAAFGLALWSLLVLVLARRPAWLKPGQAMALAAASFVLQGLVAGLLTLLGAWPYPKIWYFGAAPFLFAG